MSVKVFLDSNILVYAHTDLDIAKQKISQDIIRSNESYISTQVLQEIANVLNKKFGHDWKSIAKILVEAGKNNILWLNNENTIAKACDAADKYGYSFYDSLIISAAVACDCIRLYSEDLQHNQILEGGLQIINPFV